MSSVTCVSRAVFAGRVSTGLELDHSASAQPASTPKGPRQGPQWDQMKGSVGGAVHEVLAFDNEKRQPCPDEVRRTAELCGAELPEDPPPTAAIPMGCLQLVSNYHRESRAVEQTHAKDRGNSCYAIGG